MFYSAQTHAVPATHPTHERAAFRAIGMTEFDHLQTAVLKDLSKMMIAGAGIVAFLALVLWGMVTSAEAAASTMIGFPLS